MPGTCKSAIGPANPRLVQYDHDRDADVLYMSIGTPQPAICREVLGVEGLHLLYALADGQICGATIVWYSMQQTDQLRAAIPFAVDLP